MNHVIFTDVVIKGEVQISCDFYRRRDSICSCTSYFMVIMLLIYDLFTSPISFFFSIAQSLVILYFDV